MPHSDPNCHIAKTDSCCRRIGSRPSMSPDSMAEYEYEKTGIASENLSRMVAVSEECRKKLDISVRPIFYRTSFCQLIRRSSDPALSVDSKAFIGPTQPTKLIGGGEAKPQRTLFTRRPTEVAIVGKNYGVADQTNGGTKAYVFGV